MHSFETADHTADIRLLLKGDSLHELFRAGLLGVAHVLKPGFCPHGGALLPPVAPNTTSRFRKEVAVTAPDQAALLVDFLSEILYLSNVEKVVCCEVDFSELSPTALRAVIHGAPVESFDDDIKAVTYRESEIRVDDAGVYSSTIVLDI
ncbi:MAG: archease [Spirochaetia bacterium]|nr:archease [Spirochaetia bacterium]